MTTYNYKCEDCGNEFEIRATLEEKDKVNDKVRQGESPSGERVSPEGGLGQENNSEKFKCLACSSIKIKQQLTGGNFISKSGDSHGGCAGGCCGGMCG